MSDHDYSKYDYIWKRKRNEYALFTVTCYGKTEYLLYHRPTKNMKLICDTSFGKGLVEKIIAQGIPVLEDAPACDGVEMADARA